MTRPLTRVVDWGHEYLSEVVHSGDLVVDLTAGTGQDTLALYKMVGSTGQIVAFDIQSQALLATSERLLVAGAQVRLQQQDIHPILREPGVDLLQLSHAQVESVLPAAPKAIIANLGYLPGGDKRLTTLPESTLLALERSCALLAVGGRLAVVVYPGHPGGAEEGAAVTKFCSELDNLKFQVLLMQVCNRPHAPFLFMLEKRSKF